MNGHPKNMKEGLQTVTAFGLFGGRSIWLPSSSVGDDHPHGAADSSNVGADGEVAGAQGCKRHGADRQRGAGRVSALAFRAICGVKEVRFYDIDPVATKCVDNLQGSGLILTPCTTAEDAILGAQIITTVTADKQYATILTDNMVGPGVHIINAVGGDCPGKTKLHGDILLRSDIYVEYPPQTRIEGEIQQLDPDYPVKELWQVMTGQISGRADDRAITLFDSVGFAIEDFSALRYVLKQLGKLPKSLKFSEELDMIADPDEPRDLYGMLLRKKATMAA